MRLLKLVPLLFAVSQVQSIELNPDDDESIKSTTKTIAERLFSYYTGWRPGDVPGNLPDPYYWWECGAMMGALVDYWHYTGDDQFNDRVSQAIVHQAGDDRAMMPANQSRQLGNDDQGFWGITAMMAAERNFPNPPPDQPQWLTIAQAVFNTQAARWDPSCGGGLKWQISQFNVGFAYKNTISNGCFFNIASRLASYTGNTTYAEWAERAWDWMTSVGYITPDFMFLDGAHHDNGRDCQNLDRTQWSYNAGVNLLGLAHMYNRTEDPKWKSRLDGAITSLSVFTHPDTPNTLYEPACETVQRCNLDQRSFKAYISRWLGSTMQLAPHTIPALLPILRTSAVAAAKVCAGGSSGTDCGYSWISPGGQYDGLTGVGEQMAALEAVQNVLSVKAAGPVGAGSGGTSVGDPNAGSEVAVDPFAGKTVGVADKVGAAVLTLFVVGGMVGGAAWMINPFAQD
ncbi:mannan endo-1,6-alpha-mannosidase [Pseudovirgaria hyperparasitica]|uniref:Mannan endo-1,6-alpha-mannosidase n=1 Tax=Pseudovirgaria hyperparasitica TaxID=470096 RepID=A0A6A6WDP6_9PEZI|nr:mannan endo-1,6-alpha-mannosidase [Pseudovirgaria hyperparasitica]KAF2759966.1 mannan endo-1,6-alpha-mannosidase [Pseudovirgaria hyperparasitica]